MSVCLCMKVAMGQGQAEVAMQLLQECATNGEWLCLKNLHLVTAWLPTLEKVAYGCLLVSAVTVCNHTADCDANKYSTR